jgi:hypothetical protein
MIRRCVGSLAARRLQAWRRRQARWDVSRRAGSRRRGTLNRHPRLKRSEALRARLGPPCHARSTVAGSRALFPARLRCCSSSVVEHSLGKGEVESSILSCSTSNFGRFREIDDGEGWVCPSPVFHGVGGPPRPGTSASEQPLMRRQCQFACARIAGERLRSLEAGVAGSSTICCSDVRGTALSSERTMTHPDLEGPRIPGATPCSAARF